jgi:uncharacterized membrane protein required for colicin V production
MPVLIVICLLIIAVAMVDGFRNGVIRRLLETVGLIAIFLFASRLADWLEPHLSSGLAASPKVAFFGSWLIVIVGGVITVRVLAGAAATLMQVSVVGTLDRVGGALVGLLFGSLISSLLLIACLAMPIDDDLKRGVRDHPFTNSLLHLAPAVYDAAATLWDGEDFFRMIEERLEPLADEAREGLKAFLGESERDDSGEN